MSDALRVAIVHYHLRSGGVTKVIEHAVRAAQANNIRAVVLHGDQGSPSAACKNAVTISGLEYASPETGHDVSDILAAMRTAAERELGAEPDVWHFHNHSLGKTLVVPRLVQRMAKEGYKLLLQIHDFPEDGRPDIYRQLLKGFGDSRQLANALYPCGSHVHYATLNTRDLEFIVRSGADRTNAHLLPNPVQSPTGSLTNPPDDEPPLILYATRAIRRKNIGEFLLWAALSKDGTSFGITLEPENASALQHYRRWENVSAELGLSVEFNLGARQPFPDLIARSTQLMTTSVAEGFGLSFLEPWLANRFLAGRNLPEITRDFARNGVNLEHLYGRLDVPLAWIGKDTLIERLATSLKNYYLSYGKPFPKQSVDESFAAISSNDHVDFGKLDESMQEAVISTLCRSENANDEIRPRKLATPETAPGRVDQNRIAVQNAFDLQSYGKRLSVIYGVVAASSAEKPKALSVERMLQGFLDPRRFTLLRT